ncbi:MAG: hypothetical protein ACLFUN_09065 [Desulfobacterales bacterium]
MKFLPQLKIALPTKSRTMSIIYKITLITGNAREISKQIKINPTGLDHGP